MSLKILAAATGKANDLGAGDIIGAIFISVLVFVVLPYVLVKFRNALKLYEKEIQFQQRQREHMDASERHMATVDQSLAQILEELKRRPIS